MISLYVDISFLQIETLQHQRSWIQRQEQIDIVRKEVVLNFAFHMKGTKKSYRQFIHIKVMCPEKLSFCVGIQSRTVIKLS